MKNIFFAAVFCFLSAMMDFAVCEELATYPVRWEHGMKTDFGKLIFTDSEIIFRNDDGSENVLSMVYLDEVKIVKETWIQVRSNLETGLSMGLKDVYNFGVVGGVPDPQVISECNRSIFEAKKKRLSSSALLPGERARYMVSKGETIGDDVGLLIICEDKLIYISDTGGKNHEWAYSDLNGIEMPGAYRLSVMTDERAIIKLGLSNRNYLFSSHVTAFSSDDVGFIAGKIAAAKTAQ